MIGNPSRAVRSSTSASVAELLNVGATTAGENGFVRGVKPGEFPNDEARLQTYDLIIFGDIPRATFKGDELEWIREFVANRGGALVFIDGARQCLSACRRNCWSGDLISPPPSARWPKRTRRSEWPQQPTIRRSL